MLPKFGAAAPPAQGCSWTAAVATALVVILLVIAQSIFATLSVIAMRYPSI
jgi:hypothetical protein